MTLFCAYSVGVGPLSWYLEFTKTLRGEFGFEETADPTVHFRTEKDKSIMLVLVRRPVTFARSLSGTKGPLRRS